MRTYSQPMSTTTYRRIVGIDDPSLNEQRAPLPFWVKLLRGIGFGLIFLLLSYFLSVGTMESRVTYLLAIILGFLNPLWAVYAMALLAPLYLMDQGKTHNLAGIEVFVIGMLAGELRLLGKPGGWNLGLSTAGDQQLPERGLRVYYGLWPYFLTGLSFLLIASSIVGAQLILFQEQQPWEAKQFLIMNLDMMFYYPATSPQWTMKALWNWGTGILIASIAARRMTPFAVARWLKLGSLSLVVACLYGLLEWSEWLNLSGLRRLNPDPLQQGRLQGLAGHPGWMGQWIAFMWPGLLLWFSAGRNKRNTALIGLLIIVGLTLVLTAARAPWAGVFAGACVGGVYAIRVLPQARKYIPWAAGGALLLGLLGVLIGGDVLAQRMANILRAQDRANYYVSGLLFLREHPFGLGLGTHYIFYEWLITPFYTWRQFDHVTAHSLWLHSLIENGPFVPLMLLAGVLGVIAEVKKGWCHFSEHNRTIMVALWMGLVGVLVISLAQYVFYLRIVEVSLWIALGASVGISRRQRALTIEPLESRRGPRLLLFCGVAAILMASFSSQRLYPGAYPRYYEPQADGTVEFWTAGDWKTVVERDVERISFGLYRMALPADIIIHWPKGDPEHVRLQPGESRQFSWDQKPRDSDWDDKPRWLRIEVTPLWTPSQHLEDNTDDRQLGVYVQKLKFEAERLNGRYTWGDK